MRTRPLFSLILSRCGSPLSRAVVFEHRHLAWPRGGFANLLGTAITLYRPLPPVVPGSVHCFFDLSAEFPGLRRDENPSCKTRTCKLFSRMSSRSSSPIPSLTLSPSWRKWRLALKSDALILGVEQVSEGGHRLVGGLFARVERL